VFDISDRVFVDDDDTKHKASNELELLPLSVLPLELAASHTTTNTSSTRTNSKRMKQITLLLIASLGMIQAVPHFIITSAKSRCETVNAPHGTKLRIEYEAPGTFVRVVR
jgi:hypothetical protein